VCHDPSVSGFVCSCAMPKTCDTCGQEFRGFGTTCGACRMGKDRKMFSCEKCGAVFNGKTTVCELCGGRASAVGETRRDSVTSVAPDPSDQLNCFKCGKPIGASPSVIFENNRYHNACFSCERCNKLLQIGGVFRHEDKLVCSSCIPSNFCAACGQKLTGQITKVGGKQYHPECFKCDECGNQLVGGYARMGNLNLCKECAVKKKGTGTCVVCDQMIQGPAIRADKGDLFHKECFKCFDCGQPLKSYVKDEGRQFKYQKAVYLCKPCKVKREESEAQEENFSPCHICGTQWPAGQFWCTKCQAPCYKANDENKKCCICGEAVSGPGVFQAANGFVFHEACFKCSGCGKLATDGAVEGEEQSRMRLMNAQLDAAIRGEYTCPDCLAGTGQEA